MQKPLALLPLLLTATTLAIAPAHAAGWDDIAARSTVDGIAITPLSALPPAPAGAGVVDFCDHLTVEPVSQAGLEAERSGWTVTGEIEIGELTVVSFVAGFEPGTSGSCLSRDGNVGFFVGKDLVAVAYAPQSSAQTVGRIEQFGATGVRIWDGDYLRQPIADVRLDTLGTITIEALAVEQPFCGGSAIVPNIYGLPIAEARNLVGQHGWSPTKPASDEWPDGRSADLAAAGLTEVSGCSGTGFGFCNFEYQFGGAKMSVTTAGEADLPATPAVSGYGVTCAATTQRRHGAGVAGEAG